MAARIKMRCSKNGDAVCVSCGESAKNSVDIYDVKIGDMPVFCVCDLCMEELMRKSLNAVCHTNGRVKLPRDIKVSQRRIAKGRRA